MFSEFRKNHSQSGNQTNQSDPEIAIEIGFFDSPDFYIAPVDPNGGAKRQTVQEVLVVEFLSVCFEFEFYVFDPLLCLVCLFFAFL